MENIMVGRYYRRLLLTLALIVGVVLLIFRYLLIPILGEEAPFDLLTFLAALSDNLFIALVTSIIVTVVTIWVVGETTRSATVDVVEPRRIRECLNDAIQKTNEWWYYGHIGRHFRAVTLPQLARDARQDNLTRHVYLLILHPLNDELCRYYARYRGSVRSASKDRQWDEMRVRVEIFCTIISAYAWSHQEPLIELHLSLIQHMSLFRVDLSSRLALITKEDPLEPALRYDANTFFYNSYKEELKMAMGQGVHLPAHHSFVPLRDVNQENARKLLNSLGFDTTNLDEAFFNSVVSLCLNAENPYA